MGERERMIIKVPQETPQVLLAGPTHHRHQLWLYNIIISCSINQLILCVCVLGCIGVTHLEREGEGRLLMI